MSNQIGGVTADELEERITEAEFRERWALKRQSPPEANDKLDIVIALLWCILSANVSLAGSWIKGYQPPDVKARLPKWNTKKKPVTFIMPAQEVLNLVRSFKSP